MFGRRFKAPEERVQDTSAWFVRSLGRFFGVFTLTIVFSPGSGESGKSTIVKQMKIIHQNGYTVEELSMYRLTVYKNLLDCARSLIHAMQDFDISPSSSKVRDFMTFLWEYNVDPDPNTPLDPKDRKSVV